MSGRRKTLADLPLFASDQDIGEAVLEYARRGDFAGLATLHERLGMPKLDPLWGGRYVPAVRPNVERNWWRHLAKIRPTKTEDTTEIEVSFDLTVCPMVMEELSLISADERKGPLIKHPWTGLPYRAYAFGEGWRKDFEDAGLPANIWNRDLRAAAITADRQASAWMDDVSKLAGRTKKTTEIYDRDTVEAHRRIMAARKAFGQKNAS